MVRRNIDYIEDDLDAFRTKRKEQWCVWQLEFWEKLLTGIVSRNTCVHSVAASSSTPTMSCKIGRLGRSSSTRNCISRSPTSTVVFIEAHSPSLFWLAARVVCCISQIISTWYSTRSCIEMISLRDAPAFFLSLSRIRKNKACKKKKRRTARFLLLSNEIRVVVHPCPF